MVCLVIAATIKDLIVGLEADHYYNLYDPETH